MGYLGRAHDGAEMMKEASSFFAIAMILMVGSYVFIAGQGGNMFAGLHTGQSGNCAATDYRCQARQDAIDNGLNSDLFERQINQESGWNPNAVSSAGAIGIAQFEPSTAAGLGINPYDPVQSLSGAASFMARLYTRYQNYDKALAAYNCGTDCVSRAVSNCGANWKTCVPAETQRYIANIVG